MVPVTFMCPAMRTTPPLCSGGSRCCRGYQPAESASLQHFNSQTGKVGVNKKIFTFILMHADIHQYNQQQSENDQAICQILAGQIDHILAEAESKIWHGHPVWFLDGNPIVGYSKLKGSVRLLFWSGQSFGEEALINEGKFKAAEFRITDAGQIDLNDLHRWLQKSRDIQWDYKNIVKRKGQLERLK